MIGLIMTKPGPWWLWIYYFPGCSFFAVASLDSAVIGVIGVRLMLFGGV